MDPKYLNKAKIGRTVFSHPVTELREVTVETDVEADGYRGWLLGETKKVTKTERQRYEFSKAEVLSQALQFVEGIGPDRLINVAEYTTALHRIGDDLHWHIVIWYWQELPEVASGEAAV
jgi:hypothetical protein